MSLKRGFPLDPFCQWEGPPPTKFPANWQQGINQDQYGYGYAEGQGYGYGEGQHGYEYDNSADVYNANSMADFSNTQSSLNPAEYQDGFPGFGFGKSGAINQTARCTKKVSGMPLGFNNDGSYVNQFEINAFDAIGGYNDNQLDNQHSMGYSELYGEEAGYDYEQNAGCDAEQQYFFPPHQEYALSQQSHFGTGQFAQPSGRMITSRGRGRGKNQIGFQDSNFAGPGFMGGGRGPAVGRGQLMQGARGIVRGGVARGNIVKGGVARGGPDAFAASGQRWNDRTATSNDMYQNRGRGVQSGRVFGHGRSFGGGRGAPDTTYTQNFQTGRGGMQGNVRGRGFVNQTISHVSHPTRSRGRVGNGDATAVSKSIMGVMSGVAECSSSITNNKPVSLMDLVFPESGKKEEQGKPTRINVLLGKFLNFFKTWPDRVNGIQTVTNALTACKLGLSLDYTSELLVVPKKPLFTGCLTLSGLFLTRALGLSKKAVKHECYQRAVEILRSKSVDEILALKDCGKDVLKDEVVRQSKDDSEAFNVFLSEKHSSEQDTSALIRSAALAANQTPEPNFPLADKMMMLVKGLDKPGMEEVPVTSRFDIQCFKVGISVCTIYRKINPKSAIIIGEQKKNYEAEIELSCDIYYDNVRVSEGIGNGRKDAQKAAYCNLLSRLQTEPVSKIAAGPEIPENPYDLPDFHDIVHKGAKPQEGSNRAKLQNLKLYPPDLSINPDTIVIMEPEGDTITENAYKILEVSASKCGMLLEWRRLEKGNTNGNFRCEMVLQGKLRVVGEASSKPKARNAAAATMLMNMYQTQDVIRFCSPDKILNPIPYLQLCERALQLKIAGPPRLERVDCGWMAAEELKDLVVEISTDLDKALASQQWLENELRPWIEDAIVECLEAYSNKLTLEELVFGKDTPFSARKFISFAARGLYLVPAIRGTEGFLAVHQRGITPQEMVKILGVSKNRSGRFQLVRSNKPTTILLLAEFVRYFPEFNKKRAKELAEKESLKREERLKALEQSIASKV